MGSVWRARHRTLGRHFAIKFLKTAILGGESLEQRFLREARLAASIQHRFVVDIVDFGVSPDAIPYMVMEFLEGESLDRRCRRQPPLPVRELLRIASEALLGLEAVHQAGVVHRDLKPENVMLVREADGIIPKLVDFGISSAEVARDRPRRPSQPDIGGAVMGTPWYMSPEQAGREDPDRRSDIYSIGVIVYEALVGEAPFDHPELSKLLEQVQAGGAPALVARRPELGEELSAAIARAMALEPGARFESAAEMAACLEQLAGRVPAELTCTAPSTVTRTDTELVSRDRPRARTCELGTLGGMTQPVSSWGSRRHLVVAGAAAIALAVAWLGSRPSTEPQPVTAPGLQASVVPPGSGAESLGSRAPAGAARTFTAPATAGSGVTPIAQPERRSARRARAGESRGHGRIAVPDVFRTPGF